MAYLEGFVVAVPTRHREACLRPEGDMPFDGKRMFWGGFLPILDTRTEQRP